MNLNVYFSTCILLIAYIYNFPECFSPFIKLIELSSEVFIFLFKKCSFTLHDRASVDGFEYIVFLHFHHACYFDACYKRMFAYQETNPLTLPAPLRLA